MLTQISFIKQIKKEFTTVLSVVVLFLLLTINMTVDVDGQLFMMSLKRQKSIKNKIIRMEWFELKSDAANVIVI